MNKPSNALHNVHCGGYISGGKNNAVPQIDCVGS